MRDSDLFVGFFLIPVISIFVYQALRKIRAKKACFNDLTPEQKLTYLLFQNQQKENILHDHQKEK
jgi:hypothetical protein